MLAQYLFEYFEDYSATLTQSGDLDYCPFNKVLPTPSSLQTGKM
jgi:hypothetical protein